MGISSRILLNKQKANDDQTAGYVKSALDYKKLEGLYKEFIAQLQ